MKTLIFILIGLGFATMIADLEPIAENATKWSEIR